MFSFTYLCTTGDARDDLDLWPLSDYTSAWGLAVLHKLLKKTFGGSKADGFESAAVNSGIGVYDLGRNPGIPSARLSIAGLACYPLSRSVEV